MGNSNESHARGKPEKGEIRTSIPKRTKVLSRDMFPVYPVVDLRERVRYCRPSWSALFEVCSVEIASGSDDDHELTAHFSWVTSEMSFYFLGSSRHD